MFNNVQKYPARTRRNLLIEKAKADFERYAVSGGDSDVPVWLAGRIIGILDDGFVLQDESGRIDLVIGGEGKGAFSAGWKIGDVVEARVEKEKAPLEMGEEVKGEGMKSLPGQTFKGPEWLYAAKEVFVLAPCEAEFFVGKESPNFKKAMIDLNFRENLRKRTLVVGKIREFFLKEGFLEAETPEMVRLPGMEPHLDVFKTSFKSWQAEGQNGQASGGSGGSASTGSTPGTSQAGAQDMYLITSPEYAMKKLLVAGYEKVFQICKSFRNKEHLSELHNPEFTILEWYRAFASYEDIMRDTENLVQSLCREFCGGESLEFNGHKVNVAGPWERKRVKELFEEYAGIGVDDFEDTERFRKTVAKKGYKVDGSTLYEDLFFEVFLNEIEPKLGLERPVIVYEYPVSMAALSKRCEHDPRYAERFEVYIAGLEICNAFTELNDPAEQRARLSLEREERKKMGKELYDVDESFIEALNFGMPPSGGIALGVDRVVMLVLGVKDINDVLFFPHREL